VCSHSEEDSNSCSCSSCSTCDGNCRGDDVYAENDRRKSPIRRGQIHERGGSLSCPPVVNHSRKAAAYSGPARLEQLSAVNLSFAGSLDQSYHSRSRLINSGQSKNGEDSRQSRNGEDFRQYRHGEVYEREGNRQREHQLKPMEYEKLYRSSVSQRLQPVHNREGQQTGRQQSPIYHSRRNDKPQNQSGNVQHHSIAGYYKARVELQFRPPSKNLSRESSRQQVEECMIRNKTTGHGLQSPNTDYVLRNSCSLAGSRFTGAADQLMHQYNTRVMNGLPAVQESQRLTTFRPCRPPSGTSGRRIRSISAKAVLTRSDSKVEGSEWRNTERWRENDWVGGTLSRSSRLDLTIGEIGGAIDVQAIEDDSTYTGVIIVPRDLRRENYNISGNTVPSHESVQVHPKQMTSSSIPITMTSSFIPTAVTSSSLLITSPSKPTSSIEWKTRQPVYHHASSPCFIEMTVAQI